MNAIELNAVQKHYPGFDLDLSLQLPEGCILGLIGENGAGKSTTIRLLLGMTKPDAGRISVLGRDNSRDFEPVRAEIGVVLDEPGYPDCLSPRQLGKVLSGIHRNWDAAAYEATCKKLSLTPDKPIKDFSRGMRMKLSIAAALSHHPRLLVLDEPTSGLDPVVRDEVVDLFSDFTREEGRSVLISSHIVSDLEKLCDYIAFLHKGKLLLFEEKDRLSEEYGLVLCPRERLAALGDGAVLGRRETPYGVSALVRRDALRGDWDVKTVGVEDLFIMMVKEGEQ